MSTTYKFCPVVIVPRAVPGSGKSTFTKNLIEALANAGVNNARAYSTDEYFMVNGKYCFDVQKLGKYHAENLANFTLGMEDSDIDAFVVDNCNLSLRDYKGYVEVAKSNFAKVVEVVFLPDSAEVHASRTVHSVPKERIVDMRNKLLNNLGANSGADYTFVLTPQDHPESDRVKNIIDFIVSLSKEPNNA